MKETNKEKATRLYKNFGRAMYRAAFDATNDYHLAQDAVQQAFIKVMRRLDKIDESNEHALGSLLCIMAQQAVVDLYDKKKSAIGEQIIDDKNFPEPASKDDVFEILLRKDLVKQLEQSIMRLPEKYAKPIVMRYAHGLTNQEIADILDIEVNNVYIRIHRARKMIRDSIKKGGEL